MPPHPTHSQSKCLETTLQDVDRRIHIPIQDHPTFRATMRARAQYLGYHLATVRAHLGCVARVYQDDRSASFCRFADCHTDKLSPRHIHYAFAHSATFTHLLWCQRLKHNHLIGVDQLPAALVGKVRTSVPDPLVYLCQQRFLLLVLLPILGILGCVFALLNALEIGFVPAIEARVLDLFAIRERGKGQQPDIHTRDMLGRWQGCCRRLTRDADVPLARAPIGKV